MNFVRPHMQKGFDNIRLSIELQKLIKAILEKDNAKDQPSTSRDERLVKKKDMFIMPMST